MFLSGKSLFSFLLILTHMNSKNLGSCPTEFLTVTFCCKLILQHLSLHSQPFQNTYRDIHYGFSKKKKKKSLNYEIYVWNFPFYVIFPGSYRSVVRKVDRCILTTMNSIKYLFFCQRNVYNNIFERSIKTN